MAAEIVDDMDLALGDRRGRGLGQRRSWASAEPFERRSTPFNSADAVAGSWRQIVHSYRVHAALLDLAAILLVATPVMVALYEPAGQTALMIAGATLGFVALVAVLHGYGDAVLGRSAAETRVLVRAGLVSVVVLVLASYAFKAEVSRFLVFVVVPAAALLAVTARLVLRRSLKKSRLHGQAMMRTLVVGEPGPVASVVSDLAVDPAHGYSVVGVCLPSVDEEQVVAGAPMIGAVCDVPQVVVDRSVDVVVVAGSYIGGNGLRRLSWALDRAGAQLIMATDLEDIAAPRLTMRPTGGLSLLEVEVGASRGRMAAKTALDRTLGGLIMLVALPVILVAAVAVRLTSPGSPFYKQTRIGVDGRAFTMWKLRTMYIDADARRAELLGSSEGNAILFKMRHDPRVTSVGRVLRKYSLDELPQLFNVVRGDMSLVGPRPPLAEEVAAYADAVQRRLRVRPGLTGLWQVSGRSDLSWEESVKLDLRYVDNWSVTMDLLILWKTFRAVLRPSGAY